MSTCRQAMTFFQQQVSLQRVSQAITNLGDVAQMMKLPNQQDTFKPENGRDSAGVDFERRTIGTQTAVLTFCCLATVSATSIHASQWAGEPLRGWQKQLSHSLNRTMDVLARNDGRSFRNSRMAQPRFGSWQRSACG